ncbi:hypothetical protein CLW00_103253 [Mongoliibacter ruber]|uniref:Uncharacterized protein n=1 Tax=Mongoliibacter ruber TaxID=1750599 RepID=A0A2T0WR04_9BACT|nr:hypothetical protein CLW00_103253 [Mongoliibacter ruber]
MLFEFGAKLIINAEYQRMFGKLIPVFILFLFHIFKYPQNSI